MTMTIFLLQKQQSLSESERWQNIQIIWKQSAQENIWTSKETCTLV
jgi:hypothetical protein